MNGRYEHLFVRTDATPDIGLGHFMRCFALAQHWRDLGLGVTFVGRYAESLLEQLESESIAYRALPARHPDARDLESTLGYLSRGAPAVLDGYHFDEAYQRALASYGRLLVIDDHGHCAGYAGAALLNSNLDAAEVRYQRAPKRRLLGPAYALLRRELRAVRRRAAERLPPPRAERLLVSCGGSDPLNLTQPVLEVLARCARPRQVRVLVGPLNPRRDALERFAKGHTWIELCVAPRDVATHLLWADLAIAAAGTTTWELALCGVPSILLAAADNQLPVGREMAQRGAAVFAGDGRALETEKLATMLEELIVAPGTTARARRSCARARRRRRSRQSHRSAQGDTRPC